MLKKLLATAAVFAGPAFAGAPYDGVYQVASGEWVTILEKNGTVLAAYYFSNVSNGVLYYPLANGQKYTPPRLDNWDLLSGPLVGGVATVSGETVYGACKVTAQINFSTMTFRLNTMSATPSGSAQGVNCFNVGEWMIFNHGSVNQWPLTKVW